MKQALTDWDDAYANGAHVAGSENYPEQWKVLAEEYRRHQIAAGQATIDVAYGSHEREVYDCFEPAEDATGIVVFIHGGYWMKLNKSYWSHLAAGSQRNNQRVIIPSYTLCPENSIAAITTQIARVLDTVAHNNTLPLRLVGHSAGGHLVSRMVCADGTLAPAFVERIAQVVSISGVHDLRPLQKTGMNLTLGLSPSMAETESPALLQPVSGARVTCWVGALERPEFVRQSELLANIWYGLGASTHCQIEPNRHHFDIIDPLAEPDSHLIAHLLQTHESR